MKEAEMESKIHIFSNYVFEVYLTDSWLLRSSKMLQVSMMADYQEKNMSWHFIPTTVLQFLEKEEFVHELYLELEAGIAEK